MNGSIRIQLSGSTFPGGAKQIGEDKLKWCLSDKFKEKMHKSPFYCPTVLCDKKVINLVEITKQKRFHDSQSWLYVKNLLTEAFSPFSKWI